MMVKIAFMMNIYPYVTMDFLKNHGYTLKFSL